MKFKNLLFGALLLATSLAYGQRYPTNTRYIGGNYINKAPYFNTLEAALNNVKASATSIRPYTFWLDSDTTYISDWTTMKDSINTYYVTTGKIKWAGFGYIGVTLAQSSSQMFLTPEDLGASGDGLTNDALFIKDAIEEASNVGITESVSLKNKTVAFLGNYLIEDTIKIDLEGQNLDLVFLPGSKIVSTFLATNYNYYATHGHIKLINGNKVTIKNMTLEVTNADGVTTADNGLVIESCNEVIMENVNVKYAGYAGIRVQDIDQLTMINCSADSNFFAGLMGVAVKKATIIGGSYSYNGDEKLAPLYGYGILFSFPFLTGIDNKDITITGVTAYNNYRKGIDVHGGIGVNISNNHVERFGYGAIYAVNENGTEDDFRVQDVVISGNVIKNDRIWLNSIVTDTTLMQHIIAVGSYGDTVVTGGSFKVSNNIINVDSVKRVRAAIIAFTNKTGYPINSIQISGNTITKLYQDLAYSPLYGGIVVLGDNDTTVLPRAINVNNNFIQGTAPYGVYVAYGRDIKINDNQFEGVFQDGAIASICTTCLDSTFYQREGNTYNNSRLADIFTDKRYQTSDRYSGKVERFITNSAGADSVTLLKVNPAESEANSMVATITVQVIRHTNFSTYSGTFQGYVYAIRLYDISERIIDIDPYSFVSDTLSLITPEQANLTPPIFKWVGESTEKFLRGYFLDPYTSYQVKVEFTSWRVSPYILEDESEGKDTVIDGTTSWRDHSNDNNLTLMARKTELQSEINARIDADNALNIHKNALYDSIQAIRGYINSLLPIITGLNAPILASVTADGDSANIKLIFSSNVNADTTVIERSILSTTAFASIDTVNEDVTYYRDTTTLGNTRYYYRLWSYKTDVNLVSSYSSILNDKTIDTASTPEVNYDYYVDATNGNDAWGGKSPATAWQTLTKINNTNFNAGNSIVFKRGETWYGNLTINNSNTYWGSYGEGLKPIITLKEELPGWTTSGNWQEYPTAPSNVYRMAINPENEKNIWRLWINDVEAELEPDRSTVDSLGEFYHSNGNGYLYVYSATNPASACSSIQYSGGIRTGTDIFQTVSIKDANYVVLDGLDLQGGLYATLGISGSSHDTIKNCNIGKNGQMYAVRGNNVNWDYSASSSNYNIFYSDTLDNNWARYHTTEANTIDGGDGTYGIAMENGTSYWDIYNNYVANFWFPFQIQNLADGNSLYHKIHDNEITNTINLTMGYPLTLASEMQFNDGFTNTEFYNNYCHNIYSFIEIFSSGNKIYYNIFKDFKQGTAQYQNTNHGVGVNIATDDYYYGIFKYGVDSNYIFNNTFDSTYRAVYLSDNNVYQWFLNNLILDANYYGDYSDGCAIDVSFYERGKHKNNLFYKTGSTSSTLFIDQTDLNQQKFTVEQWNNYVSGRGGKEQSENIFPTGKTKLQIMTPDFQLPSGSPALGAGIVVDDLLPDGFKDKLGNIIMQDGITKPNIGAIDNTP